MATSFFNSFYLFTTLLLGAYHVELASLSSDRHNCQLLEDTLSSMKLVFGAVLDAHRPPLGEFDAYITRVLSVRVEPVESPPPPPATVDYCRVDIVVNKIHRFQFADVNVLNKTVRYFLENADENKIVVNHKVFSVFNFNYCYSARYYSIKMNEMEMETLARIDDEMQKQRCVRSTHSIQNKKLVSFNPNSLSKYDEDYDENETMKSLQPTEASHEDEERRIDSATHESDLSAGISYILSVKILSYLVSVIIILFLLNFLLKANKHYIRDKFVKKRRGFVKPLQFISENNCSKLLSGEKRSVTCMNPFNLASTSLMGNDNEEDGSSRVSIRVDCPNNLAAVQSSDMFDVFYYDNVRSKSTPVPVKVTMELEGDRRSEYSVTDSEKMKYVQEWLNSISRVKYFLVNTSFFNPDFRDVKERVRTVNL